MRKYILLPETKANFSLCSVEQYDSRFTYSLEFECDSMAWIHKHGLSQIHELSLVYGSVK